MSEFEKVHRDFLTESEAGLRLMIEGLFGQEKSKLAPVLKDSKLCEAINDTIQKIFDTRYISYLDQMAEYMANSRIELSRKMRKINEKDEKSRKKRKIPKAFKSTEY